MTIDHWKRARRVGLLAILSTALLAALPIQAAANPAAMVARGTYPRDDDQLRLLGPADVLAMPFDVTEGKASLHEVAVRGTPLGEIVATHWNYWSENGDHLADVFICLGDDATVVVNPTSIRGQLATGEKTGPTIDLTGTRGVLLVSAYDSSPGPACSVADPSTDSMGERLVGSWTIANDATGVSFGGDPIALELASLPDATILEDGPIRVHSLSVPSLKDSEVILVALEFSDDSGSGSFQSFEFGPVPRAMALPGNPHVCCAASFTDDQSIEISVPDVCFQGVGFRPLASTGAGAGETPIIPDSVTVTTPVSLELAHCQSRDFDGNIVPLGTEDFAQFLFVFHGHAVDPPTP